MEIEILSNFFQSLCECIYLYKGSNSILTISPSSKLDKLVLLYVWGIIETTKELWIKPEIVKDIPLIATEPFSTIYLRFFLLLSNLGSEK